MKIFCRHDHGTITQPALPPIEEKPLECRYCGGTDHETTRDGSLLGGTTTFNSRAEGDDPPRIPVAALDCAARLAAEGINLRKLIGER